MNGAELRRARVDAEWTQARLAKRLDVSQAYLSLMESGKRPVPSRLVLRVASLFDLSPTVLPSDHTGGAEPGVTEAALEQDLASLGYPGLAYKATHGRRRNPADLLLSGLAVDDLDPRLVEALPWLLLAFEGFEAERLVARAKSVDLQNRLGFTVALARRVVDADPGLTKRAHELVLLEEMLEPSRLAREDTYGQATLSERMREWLRQNRSPDAQHWNLLTDLKPEHLSYAGEHQGAMAQLSS